jgi:hypothetical protein
MPIILRCAVCDKPVGFIDTPIEFNERLINSGNTPGGGMFVDGDFDQDMSEGFRFIHDKCGAKIRADIVAANFTLSTSGTWTTSKGTTTQSGNWDKPPVVKPHRNKYSKH